MKAAKTLKKLKEMSYPPKACKKKRKYITPAKTNPPISQSSSERPKSAIQTYQMRNKELN